MRLNENLLSLLLFSIMLHELDNQPQEKGLKFAGYADDFGIYRMQNCFLALIRFMSF